MWAPLWPPAAWRTVVTAARGLRRAPGFAAAVVLTLALGLGANTAIVTVVHRLLLRPLPVPHAERLVNLSDPGPRLDGSLSAGKAGTSDALFSRPLVGDLERAVARAAAARPGLVGLGAHTTFDAHVAAAGRPLSGRGALVSGGYFPTLGVAPALGRLLGPADDRPGAPPAAVASHAYWTARLGADPAAVGRPLVVNGRTLTLVGVAPRSFVGTTVNGPPDVYVPLAAGPLLGAGSGLEDRGSHWLYVFGRVAPGVTAEQAGRTLNAAYRSVVRDVEAPLQPRMSAADRARFLGRALVLTPGARGQARLHAEARTPLTLLALTAAVVLVIACANVANLLLVRGTTRDGELALRHALGASRGRLLGLLLAEALLLAAGGGAAGLLVAQATLRGLAALVPPELADVVGGSLDARMLALSAALALGTGLAFGLFPALHGARAAPAGTIRASAGQVAGGARAAARVRTALAGGQVALATALLVSAGLFVRSLVNLTREPLGLDAERVVTFGVAPGRSGYDARRTAALFRRLERELAALPGVTDVSTAQVGLLRGDEWTTGVRVPGFRVAPGTDASAFTNRVGPGYFRTVGTPLLAGREFTEADRAGAPKVTIVNEAFVRRFGLGRDAVGKRIGVGGRENGPPDREIVGVVRDAKYSGVRDAARPVAYRPAREDTAATSAVFYLRTARDPDAVLRAAPAVVRRLDPDLPVEQLTTLPAQARESTANDRLAGTLAGAFAALATLLTAVGLYGVLAYGVAQRSRELGVRAALGAAGADLRRLVLGQVGRLVLAGGLAGLAAGLAIGRAARALLHGVGPQDPVAVAAAVGVLTLVALAAGALPARRAARADPARALRAE